MKHLEELKNILCEELDKIAKKGELSAGSLDVVHKLTDTIKNIDKIGMLESDGGSSYARGRGRNVRRDGMGRYSREGGYADGEMGSRIEPYNPNRRENSYNRNGYSRDGAKDYLMEQLEEMMEQAENPKEREALKRCMMAIENA